MTKDEMPFKEISKIHKECPVCEIERDLIYGETRDILKVRGLDIDVASKIHYCPEGDHYFYSIEDEEDKFQAAYREYRKRKGLLQPEEIRAIRNQYRLSQKSFSLSLGWGDITIHRYETGAIQNDAHNDVLRMIRDFNNFKQYFEAKKNILEPDLAKLVQKAIDNIEKDQRRHTVELILNMLAEQKREPGRAFIVEARPDYIKQVVSEKYYSNEELALAA